MSDKGDNTTGDKAPQPQRSNAAFSVSISASAILLILAMIVIWTSVNPGWSTLHRLVITIVILALAYEGATESRPSKPDTKATTEAGDTEPPSPPAA